MIWWPVTGGSNLVALVSFTSELAFFIHILGDKKKLSPNFYQNLDIGSPTKAFLLFCFHSKIESLKTYKKKLLIGFLSLFIV